MSDFSTLTAITGAAFSVSDFFLVQDVSAGTAILERKITGGELIVFLTGNGVAASSHTHTGVYSPVGHTHLATDITDLTTAVQAIVNTQLDIAGAPGLLDTINELAAAINDDENFFTTISNALALKAPLASPAFTGTVTVGGVTVSLDGHGHDFSEITSTPTTLVDYGITDAAPIDSPTFTGTPSLPSATTAVTQSPGDNSTAVATTEYVDAADALKVNATDLPTTASWPTQQMKILAGSTPFTYVAGDFFNGVLVYQLPPAIGDSLETQFVLKAGSYTLTLYGYHDTAAGEVEYFIDGVSQGTIDWYNGGGALLSVRTIAITVLTDGLHTLRVDTIGKNAGSSNYYYTVCLYCIN